MMFNKTSLLLFGLLSLPGSTAWACEGQEPEEESNTVFAVDAGDSPTLGDKNAPVTVVVFSDFECHFCQVLSAQTDVVMASRPGMIRLVVKPYPLPSHPNAPGASLAALASARQGRFAEYQRLLFSGAQALTRETLELYATKVGLDLQRFRADMGSESLAAELEALRTQAASLEVRGTPTIFINGKRFVGLVAKEKLEREIDAALNRTRAG